MTKLRLAVHTLRIQAGKYENKAASIPLEEKLCWFAKETGAPNEDIVENHLNIALLNVF